MGALNLLLWAAGIALIAVGWLRVRRPWNRYQSLKAQEANIARYQSWRGGLRDDGRSGASVAMQAALREAQLAGLVIVVGVVAILVGFAAR